MGLHTGEASERDGDYFGREVNLASRVANESGAGEVLVTRAVVTASGPELTFKQLDEVRMKGFSEATEIFLAELAAPGGAA